jgi:hypothetical protein
MCLALFLSLSRRDRHATVAMPSHTPTAQFPVFARILRNLKLALSIRLTCIVNIFT